MKRRSYERIIITCKDSAGHLSRQDVNIRVSDTNDNRPVFQPRNPTLHIQENEERLPTPLTPAVYATDADEGVNKEIVYSIAPVFQNQFQINPRTGVISAKQVFDREHKER